MRRPALLERLHRFERETSPLEYLLAIAVLVFVIAYAWAPMGGNLIGTFERLDAPHPAIATDADSDLGDDEADNDFLNVGKP